MVNVIDNFLGFPIVDNEETGQLHFQIKRLYNATLEIEGIVLTMYDARLNLTNQVVGEIKKFFADKLYKTAIPRGVRLSEAPSYGMPIQYYDKRSKGSIAYNDLSKEFLKKNRRG